MAQKPAHLTYKVEGISGAVNRFSPEGYETLSDELSAYLDFVAPTIPEDSPILLELEGATLDEGQQAAVMRALDYHYRLRLTDARNLMRKCRAKTIWFALSFLLSSLLIFAAENVLDEVMTQFLYLPFWFFGYRVLTFPIFDYLPARKEAKLLERLLTMHVAFTRQQAESAQTSLEGIPCVNKDVPTLAPGQQSIVDRYFMEDGHVCLECVVESIDDLLSPAKAAGHQLLASEIACYLECAEPFIKRNTPVDLRISGIHLSASQLEAAKEAIGSYYEICRMKAAQAIKSNLVKVAVFAACLAVCSLVLSAWGGSVSAAGHEFILIVLWFFGDYLIEFALLEHMSLRSQKRVYETIAAMNVVNQ